MALALRGHGLPLAGYTTASLSGRLRAEAWLARPACPTLAALVGLNPALYFICVPDAAVADVGAELAAYLADGPTQAGQAGAGPRPVVAHTSGATSVTALSPCEKAGAAALVFHPLQTFANPLTGASRFAGAGVALTPGPVHPDEAGTTGLRMAEILGMRAFFLADDKRTRWPLSPARSAGAIPPPWPLI